MQRIGVCGLNVSVNVFAHTCLCVFQIECAMRREKSAFDHINTDWNLPNEDGSTDFSDDDTVIDERVS